MIETVVLLKGHSANPFPYDVIAVVGKAETVEFATTIRHVLEESDFSVVKNNTVDIEGYKEI
jgi:hypothetical protein